MTAGSGASISRRTPSAPGAAPGPSTRCEWAPQRDGPRGIAGLSIRGSHLPARRGCEPGSHFSQSGVHRAASTAGGFPGPEGLENKTLSFPPDSLPAHPAPCPRPHLPLHARDRLCSGEGSERGCQAVASLSHSATFLPFRTSSFSPRLHPAWSCLF